MTYTWRNKKGEPVFRLSPDSAWPLDFTGRSPPSEGQAASASHPSRKLRCVSAKGGILNAEDIAA